MASLLLNDSFKRCVIIWGVLRLKVVIQFIRLMGVSLGFSILIGQTGVSANRQQSVHNNNVGFSVAAEIPKIRFINKILF